MARPLSSKKMASCVRNRTVPTALQTEPAQPAGDVLLRGFQFTHEAVRDWEARFAPLLAEQLRRRRKGKIGGR
jgi:hypothetical protein